MKEKSKHLELDALFNACLEGELNEEEAAKLSQLIEGSSEARERYWQLASVHGLVEQSMQNASLKAATGQEFVAPVKTGGFFRWPRLLPLLQGSWSVSSALLWSGLSKFPSLIDHTLKAGRLLRQVSRILK